MNFFTQRPRRRPIPLGNSAAQICMTGLLIALAGCASVAAQTPTSSLTPTVSASATATTAAARSLVTPVGAPPYIHEVSNTVTPITVIPPAVSASCPAGEVALGGGWSVPQDRRVDKVQLINNTWTVYTYYQPVNQQGIGAAALPASQPPQAAPMTLAAPSTNSYTAYVECLAGAVGAVVLPHEVDQIISPAAFPDDYTTIWASCPPGWAAVGGGFDLSASGAQLELKETAPLPIDVLGATSSGWEISVKNHDVTPQVARVYVYCELGYVASYYYAVGGYIYASQMGSVTVNCPAGLVLAGGGLLYRSGNDQNHDASNIGNLFDLHATPGGWQGTVFGVTGYGLIPLIPKVSAVCLQFT
jgi:hypothetical protein